MSVRSRPCTGGNARRCACWLLIAGMVLAACAPSPPLRDYRDAEALSDRALSSMNAGENAQAIALLNRVIAYNGGEVRDLTRRAAALGMMGQFTAALRDLDQAAMRDPQDWRTYLLRGQTHQKAGDFPAAIRDFSVALAIAPEDAGLVRQRAYAELLAGAFGDAAQDYARLTRLTPNSDMGPFGQGVASYLAGDWATAMAMFEAQLHADPSDGITALWLAKSSLKTRAPLAWEQLAAQAGPAPEWVMVRDLLSNASMEDMTRDIGELQRPETGRRTVGACEALLFLGAWAESRGLDDRARADFHSAINACPADSIEIVEARTALVR